VLPEHPRHFRAIGTGVMGTSLVQSLAVAGRSVPVWNRTADRRVRVGAPVVVVAVTESDAAYFSLFGPETVGGVLDAILVDMATMPPHDTAHGAGTGRLDARTVVASLISPPGGP
jgi:3-hydroxyisobutyrate dehydrogenase-like beta-hydroxyacid dehydrogenase